jgi:D-beta-D-heptose 7-phosphate kinase/D-beta-D-heptose 1-phosphate adenosyltransferase
MDPTDLTALLAALKGPRVVCVGDVMVDRFVYGAVTRLSPEAPIPVLTRSHELVMLGAAGNVARNVAAFGGEVALVGLTGDDAEGGEARRLVDDESGIEGYLLTDPTRPTTLKTRFVSGGQQLLRVDLEESRPADGEIGQRLAATVADACRGAAVVLVSDYGKGVVTEAVMAAARTSGAVVIVDSKARGFSRYGPVDIIKPNAAELAFATGLPTSTDAEIDAALGQALPLCEAKAILVTRGARGMSLGERGRAVRHFPGAPREVFDVSGAGDTALAALGLALAAGADMDRAIGFSMLAAGVAVTKAGTAVVRPEELAEAAHADSPLGAGQKVVGLHRLMEAVARWRALGLRVGFTNGCFDILHKGHIAYLHQARGWCDRLIVGLNTDRSVRALKGEGRPVNDLESRALVLAGLGCVDLVAPFDEDTPLRLIEQVRPDVLVKGADYAESEVVGAAQVRAWGGEVRLADIVGGYSTTAAIARMAGGKGG